MENQIYKWHYYIADVPFVDKPGSKERPVLVLKVKGGNAHIIPFTTQMKKIGKFDIVTNLGKPGLLKIGNLQLIDKNKIVKMFFNNKKQSRISKQLENLIKNKIKLFLLDD